MIKIREEQPEDIAAIRELNRRTLEHEQEGKIVDMLRAKGGAALSLVAGDDGRVVGHIMYCPVQIGSVEGRALGPMAVDPEVQGQGIGTHPQVLSTGWLPASTTSRNHLRMGRAR